MVNFSQILESEDLILRPMQLKDFDEFVELTNQPNLWIYFTIDLSIKAELKKWMTTAVIDLQERRRLSLVIIEKSSNKIIGSTSIGNISTKDKRVEIGWTWITESKQKRGINSATKKLLLDYCFAECDIERVEVKTDVLNTPARKSLIKTGFVEEGILRSHTLMTHNRRRDTIYYSLLKEEWIKD